MYTHVLAALLGGLIASFGAWQVQDWRYNARISVMQETYATRLQKSTEEARVKEHALLAAKQKVEDAYVADKRKAVVAANNARTELDGLRNELYALPALTPGANPAAASRANASTVERQLLGECAGALYEVASTADLLAAQLVGLQSYVRDVCVAPK